MPLSAKQKKFLKARAHKLKPVVIVGAAGVTESVISEIDSSIEHHELMKVRLNTGTRDEQQAMIDTICDAVHAQCVNTIGHVAIFYRPAKEPVLQLPKD
ncbi:MAG: ribosome assembly RNA-binding protein YhbY [Gammaproteobacteria bacterium]|jgi:RNA-binding protein